MKLTHIRKETKRQALNREWRKVMKSPSRTCWVTGQPYNGLGAWLLVNARRIQS